MQQPDLRTLDAAQAIREAPRLRSVYLEAFAEAPFLEAESEADRFASAYLPWYAEQPGFACIVAPGPTGGGFEGFALGYRDAFSGRLRRHLADRLGTLDAAAWLDDAFLLVELAVRPSARHRGRGAALHDAILESEPCATAILLTSEGARAALTLYARRGWVRLSEVYPEADSGAPAIVMGRRRPPGPTP